MKLKLILIACLLCFGSQSFAVDFPWTKSVTINNTLTIEDEKLTTETYIDSIKIEAEYKARKESLEGELFWLRAQNLALFFVVSYMAVNK